MNNRDDVPLELVSTNGAFPKNNRLTVAFLRGHKSHSGVDWARAGWALMVRHNNGWHPQRMADAKKWLDADSLSVICWVYLPALNDEAHEREGGK